MSLRILIIEDELLGMERLEKNLLSIDPSIEIAGKADSVQSSIHWIRSNPEPDLIIVDIDLGDGQSFDIFKEVVVECAVIFTTCYDEHALNAFKSNAIDYLLKPIKKEDLVIAVASLRDREVAVPGNKMNIETLVTSLQQQFKPKEFRQRFLVKTGRKLTSIESNEISYFFSDGKLVYVKTKDRKKLVIDHSIEELESMLNPRHYFRANEIFIIAIDSVAKLQEHDGGCISLSLMPAAECKAVIAKHRVKEFKAWLAQ